MYMIIPFKLEAKTAGPIDRAGFIDAPVNGPAINEQIATIPPIENPIIDFDEVLIVDTLIIVNIKNIVINISNRNP